jgi:hypothetical protein
MTGAVGAGSSGAAASYGQSTLGRLIGEGAAENAFTAQLPAFGRAQGVQTLGNFSSQVAHDLSGQISDINTALPQALQNAYQTLLDREMQKGQMRGTRQQNIAQGFGAGQDRNAALIAQNGQIMQNAQAATDSSQQYYAGLDQQAANSPAAQKGWQVDAPKNIQGFVQMAVDLHRGTPGGPFAPGVKGKTWGQMRSQITSIVSGQYPDMPAAYKKRYVDQILMGAGWKPGKGNAKGKGKGAAGKGGAPQGPQGPVGGQPSDPPIIDQNGLNIPMPGIPSPGGGVQDWVAGLLPNW